MFNNVVLDVFIGLVLLYLLYSLLMTIVSEMFATWMNLRPRILRTSIEKMLNDGYFPAQARPAAGRQFWRWLASWLADFWRIFQRFFLREFKDFKHSFAARFYQAPSIKYLTSRAGEPRTFFTQTKPSYISADNFADSLFRLLKESGSGTDEMDKVNFTLRFNSQHIQTGSLKQLRDLAENSGSNSQIFLEKLKAWYNETQDRATGWYKRKMQLILFWFGFLLAAIFNIDSIRIAKILAKDKDARNQLVSMGIEMAKDSLRYKAFLTNNGDSLHPQQVIDSGFAHISNDIREANLVLGLGWGTDKLRKPHSDEITTRNPAYRQIKRTIAPYDTLTKNLWIEKNQLEADIKSIDSVQNQINKYKVDSFLAETSEGRARIGLRIDSARIALQRFAAQKTRDSFSMALAVKDIGAIQQAANAVTGNEFKFIRSIGLNKEDKVTIEITGDRAYSWGEKFSHVFGKTFSSYSFWGFVITGLMISLGAPFWFDLLKRLVALRGTGVKPEEKDKRNAMPPPFTNDVQPSPSQPEPPVINTDKTIVALENFTQRTKDETGIVAIAIGYRQDTGAPFLQVIAEDNDTMAFFQRKYGNEEKLDDTFTIPIQYSIDTEITVHLAKSGSEIANQSEVLGTGTLGCHMKKKGSDDLYFISCWHVMKDNTKWDQAPVNSTIVCNKLSPGEPGINKVTLGRIEKGFLSHHPHTGIDIAVAKYDKASDMEPANDFVITAQHRSVTAKDFVLKTRVKLLGKVSGLKEARIFHNRINARVKYPDGKTYLMNDVFSITIEDAQGNNIPPTRQGDSGAVVIDEKGIPLGMVIGGSGGFSYAIKFSNLFDDDKPLKDYFFNI